MTPAATSHLVCTYCEEAFASRSKLFQHLRSNHNLDNQLEKSRLENLTPSERTGASVAIRNSYHNKAHDAYYRAQVKAGVMSEEEWNTAAEYFRKPLPVAFRLLKHTLEEQDIRYQSWKKLKELIPCEGLQPCPVLSPELAQVAVIPPRQWSEEAQQALVDSQELGLANRQELCSMIPPLLLLQKGETLERGNILDLCSAPGSKTLQIADAMEDHTDESKDRSLLLVCNDPNRQRLLTVARRFRRQPARTRQSVVLNSSDGRYFPALRKWGGFKLKFDRVLADVPCSGDGTLRKLSATDWQQWNVKSHIQLHRLQVRLLTRALECVGKGGRVVYSTCSLDPIEDEAVLVTAIARMGGPSVYKIVPIPERLSKDAVAKFAYSKGATNWIVPHPEFGKPNKNDGDIIYDTFETIDQVPLALRKKQLSPSMFPPHVRTEQSIKEIWKDHEELEKKLVQARFYGEILSDGDVAKFEEMLPNCGRILPQHLDSGGFFCAVIERVAPAYYPVCFPAERSRREAEDGSKALVRAAYNYHGRILTGVKNVKHVREFVAGDKDQGDEVLSEGLPTFELAVEWLKKHRAYQKHLSEQVIVISTKSDESKQATQSAVPLKKIKREYVKDPNNPSLYTRLFTPPSLSLIEEFCEFFGLETDPARAKEAGVDVFPAHRLVVVGGGDDAASVASCQTLNIAHKAVRREDVANDTKVHRKRRFFQLVLVSEEIRNLFKGGAKFNPMEVGLPLCFVPIPGYYRKNLPSKDAGGKVLETAQVEDSSNRAVQSGRYGLLDEAAEVLGRCASKRILALTQTQALTLLETKSLKYVSQGQGGDAENQISSWWERWGKNSPRDVGEWSSGAVIAVVACGESTLFLPCVLKDQTDQQGREMYILTEQRLTEAWSRLLRSVYY